VFSNFEDTSHGREFWQMAGAVTMRARHFAARYEARRVALLEALEPLVYAHPPPAGLPSHIRSASAIRRIGGSLVIVQDDVNAFAVGADGRALRAVLLPAHASGQRVFDDKLGNKHLKLDLEACVTLPDGRLVAFGSGSLPAREHLVVWNGRDAPALVAAAAFYAAVRAAVPQGEARLNVEGAVIDRGALRLFHRGNDTVRDGSVPVNAIVAVDAAELARWLDGAAAVPRVTDVATVDLGDAAGVPYGFTDAVALDDGRIVVLACAESSSSALTDGAVLGCRVGLLDDSGLTTFDVCDAGGARSLLKLEGIERRPGSASEFDVVVDSDSPAAAAFLGRLHLGGI
jgi:hypothetical protein